MPLDLTCEDFGLTQEEMLNRLLGRMADKLLGMDSEGMMLPEDCSEMDEEEYRYVKRNTLEKKLQTMMQVRVDQQVAKIAEEHVLPHIDKLIDGLKFQKTNSWGEPKSPPETVREYITRIANDYLSAEVDNYGKTKAQGDYNWRKHNTMLVWAIEKHVKWHLDSATEQATKDIQGTFADQVSKLVNEVIRNMKVTMSTTVQKSK